MKKFTFQNKLKTEKLILNFIKKNRFKIYLFSIPAILLLAAPFIPYANVFISIPLSFTLLLFLFQIMFSISYKYIYALVCVLFSIAACLLILGQQERVDDIGNIIFNILLSGILVYAFKSYEEKAK